MILNKLHFVLLGGGLLGVGCGVFDPTMCTTEARSGITVDVRDSVTNALVGRGSLVVAREGAFADTASQAAFNNGPYSFVFERAGTYTVSVAQTGYQPWTKAGVQVANDGCHVNGVAFTARLQK